MTIIFALLYFMFICTIVFAGFFIVTRLQKYSINPKFTKPLIVIFIIVTIILVLVNITLFMAIPFDELFYNNLYY